MKYGRFLKNLHLKQFKRKTPRGHVINLNTSPNQCSKNYEGAQEKKVQFAQRFQ